MKQRKSFIYKVKSSTQRLNTTDSIDNIDYKVMAKQLIKQKSYFFMDFSEFKDLRIIERIDSHISDEQDQQTSKIGKNVYLTSIQNLNENTKHMYDYLAYFKNYNLNKQRIRSIIKQKKNKLLSSKKNNISHVFQPQLQEKGDIGEFLNKRRRNFNSNKILKKQQNLCQKQGILANFMTQIKPSHLSHANLTKNQTKLQKYRKSIFSSKKIHNITTNTLQKFPKIQRILTQVNSKQQFF